MNDSETLHHNEEHGGHEQTGVSVRGVIVAGGALVTLIVAAMFFMRILVGYLSVAEAPAARSAPEAPTSGAPHLGPLASEPPLRSQPARDLKMLRAAEDELLESYGWVDREAGIARIPIERAVQILAENGFPTAPQTDEEN